MSLTPCRVSLRGVRLCAVLVSVKGVRIQAILARAASELSCILFIGFALYIVMQCGVHYCVKIFAKRKLFAKLF